MSAGHEPGTVDRMAEEEGTDRLAVVRWNIQRRRTMAGLSQADLAERMTERGLKFFPQTIQKIENGSRTLRFDEAVVLAESLGIELWELLQRPTEEILGDEVLAFERAEKQIGTLVAAALQAQERVAVIIDQAGDMGDENAARVLEAHPLSGAHDAIQAGMRFNRMKRFVPSGPDLSRDVLMTHREPEHFAASPDGSDLRLNGLLERRRAWFGESDEGEPGGVDPEAS